MARSLNNWRSMNAHNKPKKPLTISTQTLRTLRPTELVAAQGGLGYSNKLPYYCTVKCPTWNC
jgi:hypothetical protein